MSTSRLPKHPPPIFGQNTFRLRIQHKQREAAFFFAKLEAQEQRFRKLAGGWNKKAMHEMEQYMYYASAFISAARSTYAYLQAITKRRSPHSQWLADQENKPIHEIGRHLRHMMLHEATPNAGLRTDISPPRPGESLGEAVWRSLVQAKNAAIVIDVAAALPKLSNAATTLARTFPTTTELFGAILAGISTLVSEADQRGMLRDESVGPPSATSRRA